MSQATSRKLHFLGRWLPVFLLWLAVRSLYLFYLGTEDPDYRVAAEAGFGPALWLAEVAFAFLAVGSAVAMWLRWHHTVSLTIVTVAIYASVTAFQLWQMERDPARARRAYVASREARGLPVLEDRLDQMFSPAGRQVAWFLGGAFCLVPLAVLLWRRTDFEPLDGDIEA